MLNKIKSFEIIFCSVVLSVLKQVGIPIIFLWRLLVVELIESELRLETWVEKAGRSVNSNSAKNVTSSDDDDSQQPVNPAQEVWVSRLALNKENVGPECVEKR